MDIAIWARGVCKTYGGKNGNVVLDKLDMTVRKGTVYGLLGASGCGKTTLLSTIVGSRPVSSGQISVLGRAPHPAHNNNIGYMPQDIALVGELTVKGAIYHFGWLFGMPNSEIEERYQFLTSLLDLPPGGRMVKNLSGGQQRRVSLAVALVHNPEILILDEPTVGIDPVLRHKIWEYLVQLTRIDKKTIIITTHYIEEAGQADTIGLMRNGRLLSEGSPATLMAKFNCTNIEDVFLLLSRKQQDGALGAVETGIEEIQLEDVATPQRDNSHCKSHFTTIPEKLSTKNSLKKTVFFTNYNHTKALVSKNFQKLLRNKGNLVFSFLFPVVEMCLFLLTIGGDPNTLQFGVINPEMEPYSDCQAFAMANPMGGMRDPEDLHCNYSGLACKFLLGLPYQLSHHVFYNDTDEARLATLSGHISGFLTFNENFTTTLGGMRENFNQEVSPGDLDQIQINVDIDKSSYPIFTYVERGLLERFNNFSQEIETECGYHAKGGAIPIRMLDAVYSSYDAQYTEYMAPGFMLTVSIFLALSVSALSVVTERLEGSWERTLISGVSTTEIVIFHFLTMSVINFIQNIILFVVTFLVFGMECRGSLSTVMLLLTLQGVVGTAMGTFVSVVSRTVSESILFSLGLFYPLVVMAGICWPLEGMPYLVRLLSYYAVPTTISIEAMANAINRGWGILNIHVAKGVFSSVGWCIFLNVLNIGILKVKDSS